MSKLNASGRLREFNRRLPAAGLDGYLVSGKTNLGFLTGFFQEGWLLLAGGKKPKAFLSPMLFEQFRSAAPFCEAVSVAGSLPEAVAAAVRAARMKKTGFDSSQVSYSDGKFWVKNGLVEKPGFLLPDRERKTPYEMAMLRRAGSIAARAFDIARKKIKPGMTEREAANELEEAMEKLGADGLSFDTILASGPNSSYPHYETGRRKIKYGEPLLMDFGCVYRHFCSDMTRTLFLGKPPEEFKKIYSIVDRAQKAGLKFLKDGVKASDADAACRDIISEEGYGETFIHSTGHGIGIEVHESPRLRKGAETVLRAGMAVTVEPGIYLAGKFGVRIEDTVLVTKKGCEILTR